MDRQPPSQKLLFLSDTHLGGFSEEQNSRIERELIHLIDHCQSNNIKIYILGDLFDYWMEYPGGHRPELGAGLRERFAAYNQQLGPTLFITGNHDNWTREYFGSIGFDLERDYRVITPDGTRVLLLHGDGTLTPEGELDRPFLHRMLRNKRFVRLFQTLFPPRTGLFIMKWFSKLNRLWGELVPTDPTELNTWAEHELRKTETEIIICGHDHEPRKLIFSFGTYINLGNFYENRTVGLYTNNGFELVFWNDASRQLDNFDTP